MTLAKATRCTYTRYADDISISGFQPPTGLFANGLPPAGRIARDLLDDKLQLVFTSNGFVLNAEKTHYADRHSRRSVTGLRVNELLNVDRRYIRNLRAAIYRTSKVGRPTAQAELAEKFGNSSDLGAHLQGRLAWVAHVKGRADPTFRSLAARFNKVFPDRALKIPPTPIEMRDRSIWIVEHDGNKGTQGTAFFLSTVGLVTACHCVEGRSTVDVYHPSKPSNRFPVSVLRKDKHRDLALLDHSAIPETEYYQLEKTQGFGMGEAVTAVGYPGFGKGDGINVRPGFVASFFVRSFGALRRSNTETAAGQFWRATPRFQRSRDWCHSQRWPVDRKRSRNPC